MHRGVPAAVWAVTGFWVALLAAFTLLYPAFRGFDEGQHVDMVEAVLHGDGWPGPGQRIISQGVLQAQNEYLHHHWQPPYTGDGVTPRPQRPSFRALGGFGPNGEWPVPNQMTQHPPLFYGTAAAFLEVFRPAQGCAYDCTVGALRFFDVLLLAPLPLLVWATARRLVGDGPVAVASSALPLAVPGLLRVGASVNNDNMLTVLTAVLLLVLVRVAQGDLRLRTAALAGGLLTLAELTKAFGLTLWLAVAVAYLLGWRAAGGRLPWRPAGLAAGLGLLGVGWYVRNQVLYGAVQPQGLGHYWFDRIYPQRPGPASVGEFALGFVRRVVWRFWSALGLPDNPHLAEWVTYLLTALCTLAVVVALLLRRREGRRGVRWLLLMPLVGFAVAIAAGTWTLYARTLEFAGVQGRYFYPVLSGVAVLVAMGARRVFGARGWLLLPVLLVVAMLVDLYALRVVAISNWLPSGAGYSGVGDAWSGIVRWSPWPAAASDLLLALPVATGLVALAVAVRGSLRRTPAAEPTT